ncbi:hypothetical protein ACWEGX_31155, partial [Streptomyces chartreusis]
MAILAAWGQMANRSNSHLLALVVGFADCSLSDDLLSGTRERIGPRSSQSTVMKNKATSGSVCVRFVGVDPAQTVRGVAVGDGVPVGYTGDV